MSWNRCAHVGADEDDRARPDRPLLVADADRARPRDHVVDLVLGVRALRIRAAGGQHVHAHRQVVGPDELVVQAARRGPRRAAGRRARRRPRPASLAPAANRPAASRVHSRDAVPDARPGAPRSARPLLALATRSSALDAVRATRRPRPPPPAATPTASSSIRARPRSHDPAGQRRARRPRPPRDHASSRSRTCRAARSTMVAPDDGIGPAVRRRPGRPDLGRRRRRHGPARPDARPPRPSRQRRRAGPARARAAPRLPERSAGLRQLHGHGTATRVVASLALDPDDPNRLDPASAAADPVRRPAVREPQRRRPPVRAGRLPVPSFGDGGSGGDPHGQRPEPRRAARQDPAARRRRPDAATDAYAHPAGQPVPSAAAGRDEIWLWACATRGGRRSTARPATCGSATSARTRGRRSTSPAPASAASTSAGTGWRATTATQTGERADRRPDAAGQPSTATTSAARSSAATSTAGAKYPALAGAYLFADYCSGRIFALDPATDGFRKPVEVGNGGSGISSFGEDAAGELYVTNLGRRGLASSSHGDAAGRQRSEAAGSDVERVGLLRVDAQLGEALRPAPRA